MCDKFESLINGHRKDLFQLVFNYFDSDEDGKISETDLFVLMKWLSKEEEKFADKLSFDFLIIQSFIQKKKNYLLEKRQKMMWWMTIEEE